MIFVFGKQILTNIFNLYLVIFLQILFVFLSGGQILFVLDLQNTILSPLSECLGPSHVCNAYYQATITVGYLLSPLVMRSVNTRPQASFNSGDILKPKIIA